MCEYTGSLFVGHCPAGDLLEHFYHFIQDLNLDLDNLINLGMDGPSVNKKLEKSWKRQKTLDSYHLGVVHCTLSIMLSEKE